MIYLDAKQIETVRRILKKHLPTRKIVAFGSRVKGDFKPHSDLDLCIMGDEGLSFQDLAYLREDFSDSDLPFRVDIVEWTTISPEFQQIILDESVVI